MLSRLHLFFHSLLHNPGRVALLGAVITFFMLFSDGSLLRFWNLQRGQQDMQQRMTVLEEKAKNLEFKIHQADNLSFIERQATDQFDYVREGDLIFVFSD